MSKFMSLGYDFDHEIGGWLEPAVFDSFEDAREHAYERWQDYQNRYVIDTWEGDDEDFFYFNYFEEGYDTAEAVSKPYDSFECCIIQVRPIPDGHVIVAARDTDWDTSIRVMFGNGTLEEAVELMSLSVSFDAERMDEPISSVRDRRADVFDAVGDCNEYHYLIV